MTLVSYRHRSGVSAALDAGGPSTDLSRADAGRVGGSASSPASSGAGVVDLDVTGSAPHVPLGSPGDPVRPAPLESWHGTLTGYSTRDCRYRRCRRAMRLYQQGRRAKQKEAL